MEFVFLSRLGTVPRVARLGHYPNCVCFGVSQATMPSTFKHPAHVPMWRGAKVGYFFIAACLFPVAIGGFWAYGNLVSINHWQFLVFPGRARIHFPIRFCFADAFGRDAQCLVCISQP